MKTLAFRLGVLLEAIAHVIAHAGRTTADIDIWSRGDAARP